MQHRRSGMVVRKVCVQKALDDFDLFVALLITEKFLPILSKEIY